MISRFLFGLTSPFQAVRLILKNPKLLTLSIIPALIALGLFMGTLYGWWAWWIPLLGVWSAGVQHGLGAWIVGLGAIGSFALILIVFLYALPIIIGLTASPFQFYLSQITEKVLLGEAANEAAFSWRMFFEDIRITLVTLVTGLVAWIVFWVPILGWIAYPFLLMLLAFDFLYYPMARRGMNLVQCVTWIGAHLPETLGLGLALTIGFGIPGINILLIPVAVVAGTLVYLR